MGLFRRYTLCGEIGGIGVDVEAEFLLGILRCPPVVEQGVRP